MVTDRALTYTTEIEIEILLEEARQLNAAQPAQALTLAERAAQLAQQAGYRLLEARSWQTLAHFYQMQAQCPQAVQAARRAQPLYQQLAQPKDEAAVLGLLAALYAQMADYRQALEYFQQQLESLKQWAEPVPVAICLASMGGICVSLEQYDQALARYESALTAVKQLEKTDPLIQAFVLNGLGYTYLKLNQPAVALPHLQQAHSLALDTTSRLRVASTCLALGEAYRMLGQFESAAELLKQGANLFGEIGDKRGVVGVNLELGKLYQQSRDFEQGIAILQAGIQLAEESQNWDGAYHLHETLSDLYEDQGDPKLALAHYKQFARLKAEVNNSESQRALAATQTRFELEKSEQEREIFRLRNVELASALQEIEAAHQEIISLNEQLKAENLRMGAELEITRRLQQMILPGKQELTQVKAFEIAAFMQPANEVGGDYYDLLRLSDTGEDGQLYLGIGDVTGHGLESGVLMLMVQTAFNTLLRYGETDLPTILATINRTIYSNTQRMGSEKNLSLALVSLDTRTGKLVLSGQHEELIVVRSSGQLEIFDTINLGFCVGLIDEIADFISQQEIQLAKDDLAIFYTDGITEAENLAGKMYGMERLCEVAVANRAASAEALKQTVIEDVLAHIGQQTIFDDLTLLVIKKS